MSQETSDVGFIKAVVEAGRLLDYLAAARQPVGVRQLAADASLSKSTCQRLLASLESVGVVEQDGETGRYQLGWKILSLATAYQRDNSLVQVGYRVLSQLTRDTGETSCLYIPGNGGRVPVVQIECEHELRWTAQIGRVYPLYLGAAGKALLAFMPEEVIEQQLALCASARDGVFAERVRQEIPEIRREGLARSTGENLPGVAGVAVPILNPQRVPVASLSVYGPVSRVDPAFLSQIEQPVREAAQEIFNRLGYHEEARRTTPPVVAPLPARGMHRC